MFSCFLNLLPDLPNDKIFRHKVERFKDTIKKIETDSSYNDQYNAQLQDLRHDVDKRITSSLDGLYKSLYKLSTNQKTEIIDSNITEAIEHLQEYKTVRSFFNDKKEDISNTVMTSFLQENIDRISNKKFEELLEAKNNQDYVNQLC